MGCVRMFEPPPETVIGLTINVAVETFPETAGEYMDVDQITHIMTNGN